jgi:tetratricopeptide (TPR) repeat protein
MTSKPPPGAAAVDLVQCADRICDRFEHAWKDGKRPRIEDFLADFPQADPASLLRELILLDMAYRRQAGELPRGEDYHVRFPSLDPIELAAALRESPETGGAPVGEEIVIACRKTSPDPDPQPPLSVPACRHGGGQAGAAGVDNDCREWSTRLIDIVNRFEEAWDRSPRPAIDRFLPNEGPQRRAILAHLVRVDLERRLKAGEWVCVEAYLGRHPELAEELLAVLDLIAAEYTIRLRLAPPVTPEEFLRRFPQYHEKLLARLAQAGRSSDWQTATLLAVPAPVEPNPIAEDAISSLADQASVEPSPADTAVPIEPDRPAAGTSWPAVRGYEILDVLGRGAMGIVYKARQLRLKRLVALKMILAGEHAGPDQVARFRIEAEAVARLQHPNIVQIHDVGEQDGRPYFSLELVTGGSLAQKLKGTPLPEREAAQLVELLARAVQVAHERGIIHRDLKPGNVLLTPEGSPKITDFGLAKRLDAASAPTQIGAIMGTPSYMAPEQAAGLPEILGPATDVYALGAILYELLTGRPPFRAATPMETVWQVLHEEPVPPSRMQPRLARDLETICLKCLQKEMPKRYAGALDLAEDLRSFQDHHPIRARPVGRLGRARKWVRRQPAMAALLALSAVVVLGLAASGVAYTSFLTKRAFVDSFVVRAEEAIHHKEWDEARDLLDQAESRCQGDAALASRLPEIEKLSAIVQEAIISRDRQEEARDKYERFCRCHDKALFYATLALGTDAAANWDDACKVADQGRSFFPAHDSQDGKLTLELEDVLRLQNHEIRDDSYDLLLVLAEAAARDPAAEEPGQGAKKALALLDQAAHLIPPIQKHGHIYHQHRARYLEQAGMPDKARREQKLADGQPPATAIDYFWLGQASYKKNVPQAQEHFAKAHHLQPNHFAARYFEGLCLLSQKHFQEAEKSMDGLQHQHNDFVWIYLVKGYANFRLGEWEKADNDFGKAETLARRDDERYVLYLNRGAAHLERAKLEQAKRELLIDTAIRDFRKAIELQPRNSRPYVSLAEAYQADNQLAEATAQLSQAIERNKSYPILYRMRARLFQDQKRLDEALSDVQEAIRLSRQDFPRDRQMGAELARDQVEKGSILYHLNRFAQARDAYDQALIHDTDQLEAYLGKSDALLRLTPPAYAEVIKALELYHKKGGKPSAEIFQRLGHAHAQLVPPQYPDAVRCYSLALQLKPNALELMAARGWIELISSDYRAAAADFNGVIEGDRQNAQAYIGRGTALVRMGDYEKGVADAQKAQALLRPPVLVETHYNLGRIYAVAANIRPRPGDRRKREPPGLGIYRQQAVKELRRALEGTPRAERVDFWQSHVATDNAWDAVRSTPEFKSLHNDYVFGASAGQRRREKHVPPH